MSSRPTIDEVLGTLRDDPETFRRILTDKEMLLELMCSYATWKSGIDRRPPWVDHQ